MQPSAPPLPRPFVDVIASLDWLRRRWSRALGAPGRALIRRRELRVATLFSLVITTAFIGALVAPFWLLVLGPVVWGVPHVVADIRYLVLRSGYHRRRLMGLLGGATLLWMGIGGPLFWGLIGVAGVALAARSRLGPKLVVFGLIVASAFGLDRLGYTGELVFAHTHNFMPVVLWWLWRRRHGHLHWIPLFLLIVCTCFLLSGWGLEVARATGGLDWYMQGMRPEQQTWRLATGLDPAWGMRLVLLFCFSQSLHYAMWLTLLPDEDRLRATPQTFRASVDSLRADLGGPGLVVAALLSLGVTLWALVDILGAHQGYFRMAHFHGHLEVMGLALLVLEGRPRIR